MSWTDRFCKSPELSKKEQSLCYQLASDFWELLSDLKKKGYLRSGLMLKKGEEERANSEYILELCLLHLFNCFLSVPTLQAEFLHTPAGASPPYYADACFLSSASGVSCQ